MPSFLARASLEVISLALHEPPKPHPNLEFIPPVPHLLTSNGPPSDAERALIQDAIEDVSARQVLDPDQALEFIPLHRSVLSTFRRFPNEIIGYIICKYSESSLVSESTLVMGSYDGFWDGFVYPIAPSQVCQSWRSISLSLPYLWAHISIKASVWKPPFSQPTESFLRFLEAVIHRSCEAPLSISIHHTSSTAQDFDAVAHILASHSTRWRTLRIVSSWPFLIHFRNIKHHLPILKQLYLRIYTETDVIDLFQDAPQLEQVFLYGETEADIRLPWPQIKTFINKNPLVRNGNPNYPVMSESPIVDLRVLNVTHHDLLNLWPERTLQYLETLHLGYSNIYREAPTDNFLGSLTLPKVSTIRVTNYSGNLFPPLFALLSRSFSGSSCMLSTLELFHPLTARELVSLSQVATSLENLVARLPGPLPDDCEGFLRLAFRPESNTPPLLPNLQKLHFFLKGGCYQAGTLTDDRIEGLTQIAETWCEIEEPRNCQHPPLGKIRRLQDFRIVLRNVLQAKKPSKRKDDIPSVRDPSNGYIF